MIAKRSAALLGIVAASGLVIASYCLGQLKADAPTPPPAGTQPMPPGMDGFLRVAHQLAQASFDPKMAGFMAIAGIKDEFHRKPDVVIKDLEDLLAKTKTLGFRTEIHFLLRDLYKSQGDNEKALENLRAVVAENDPIAGETGGPQAEPKR